MKPRNIHHLTGVMLLGLGAWGCLPGASAQTAEEATAAQAIPRAQPVEITPPPVAQPPNETTPPVATAVNPDAGNSGAPVDPQQPVELRILSPRPNEVVALSDVDVFLELKNYQVREAGNRLRIILDNGSPFTAYGTAKPITLPGLAEGGHTLRVFAAKPDGTLLRDAKAFAMCHFYVKKKDFQNYAGSDKPCLTVNLPAGDEIDTDLEGRVCFDYTVGCPSGNDTGTVKVHYIMEGYEGYLTDPGPVYWGNIPVGRHKLVVELFDANGQLIIGAYNRVERVFEVRQVLKAKPVGPEESGNATVIPQ